jgi:ribosomal protein S18 acetylase RimI-like enzyme
MKIFLKETMELDYEKVVDLFFSVNFLHHPEKRKEYKEAIEKAFRNSQYVVAAYDVEKLVGFARVLTDKVLFATIWNMIIAPEYQKKGIGKMLLEKCLDKYPTLHYFLVADDDVVGFYQKSGFKLHQYGMYLEKGRQVCVIYN